MKILGVSVNHIRFIVVLLFFSTAASAGSFVERVYGAKDIYLGDRVCGHALRGDWELMIDDQQVSCTIGDCGEFLCEDYQNGMLFGNRTFDGIVLEGAKSNHWLFVVTEEPEQQYPRLVDHVYSATCVKNVLYVDYLIGRTPRVTSTYMFPSLPQEKF